MINHDPPNVSHSPLAVLTLTVLSLLGNLITNISVSDSVELMLHIAQLVAAMVAIVLGLQQLHRNLQKNNKQ
jgi:hypothetical protein